MSTMTPAIQALSDAFWRARGLHFDNMSREEATDEETSATGQTMDDALVDLLKATPETPADLAAQARAIWWSISWPDPLGGDIVLPSDRETVPALFKAIERVTGSTVCDDPYAQRWVS